jgi:hypothetical protein
MKLTRVYGDADTNTALTVHQFFGKTYAVLLTDPAPGDIVRVCDFLWENHIGDVVHKNHTVRVIKGVDRSVVMAALARDPRKLSFKVARGPWYEVMTD